MTVSETAGGAGSGGSGTAANGTVATGTTAVGAPAAGYPAYLGLLSRSWFWCVWGVLLAALGWRLPSWDWPPTPPRLIGFTACALGFAVLAVPVRGRPVTTSARLHHVLFAHRNGVVAAGFVLLAATHRPQGWEPGVDAAALAAYLLMLDAAAVPLGVLRRMAGPGVLATLTLLIAASAALIELPGADGTARSVTAVAAAAVALAAALWAGFAMVRRR